MVVPTKMPSLGEGGPIHRDRMRVKDLITTDISAGLPDRQLPQIRT